MSKNNVKWNVCKVKNGPILGMGGGPLEDDQQSGVDNNLYYLDIDPDLPADVEINFPKHRRASATTMSAKSRKSGRQSEVRDKMKSRGRPIKPHEVEPFLSINNMPPEKSVVSEKSIVASNAVHSRARKLERESSDDSRSLEAQVQRMSACLSPFNPQTAAAPRSAPSRTGRITPANTPYHSPNKSVRQANHHVKSPFKHAVNPPQIGPDERRTPSMGMKERTALAAFHVHRMLSVASVKDAHKVSGKLQKGKLKSLYPVTVEGPKIDKCRGIVSETRSYQPSPSRTLQRRVKLMNKIPNVHEYLYERPRTVESVHRTSVASSIDFNIDHPDSNRSLPDEILYAQERSIVEPKTPENTFLPEPTQDEIVEGIQTMEAVATSSKMFNTEANSRHPERASKVQQELYQAQSAGMLQDIDDVISGDSNSMENDKTEGNEHHLNAESRARIGSPSKSVRFAEQKEKRAELQSSKEMKEIVNENIAQQQRDANSNGTRNLADVNDDELNDSVIETVSLKNKQNSKGSCKSNDTDTIFKKDEDDDNDDDVYDSKNAEDNRKQEGNQNANDSAGNTSQTSDSKGGSGKKNNSQNGGQERATSVLQAGIGFSSISEPMSENMRNSGNSPQIRKAHSSTVSSTRPLSKGSHCSRGEPSNARKAHIHSLDVSSVIHGDCVTSERSSSGANSMHRYKEQTDQKAKPCVETLEDLDSLYGNSRRASIQFVEEVDELGMDTIFLEDEVNLRGDKEVTDDVLDDSKDEKVDNMDTIRGDYSNLLEKYRRQCLDRSETYGALSNSLVTPRGTPRDTPRGTPRSCSQNQQMRKPLSGISKGDNESIHRKTVTATQSVNTTTLSDSGHGSVDSLSDLSCSASQVTSEVLRLKLGGSTSDLSEITTTSSNQEDIGGKEQEERKLLDHLSPNAQGKKSARRRQIDEDLSNLAVIATTKALSKSSKLKGTNSGGPQAVFPPLCFTINARPPQGYLYYFAYGPDMNPNRFGSYVQRDIEERYWGLLFGFNLVFNKRGTSVEAGGFSNIEFNPLRSVEGCIYKITPHELHILDKCVGYPEHYEHLVLPVWLSNSLDPDNPGVAQYCVPALTYIAQNRWTETESALNCDYALSQCIKSADIVSTAYKESLVSMATQQVTASA